MKVSNEWQRWRSRRIARRSTPDTAKFVQDEGQPSQYEGKQCGSHRGYEVCIYKYDEKKIETSV